MKAVLRRAVASVLSAQISLLGAGLDGHAASGTPQTQAPRQIPESVSQTQQAPLRALLQKSYIQLFDLAPTLTINKTELDAQRAKLEKDKGTCVSRFKEHAKHYSKQIDAAQKELKRKTAKLSEENRKQAHCKIQNLELLRSEAQALSGHAIPTAYDNLYAKLDVIEKWPALYRQTQQEIASGAHLNRRWGDVKDIGFREIAANQQDDIKMGQQAVEEMKRSGMMPKEIDDKVITEYVNRIAQQIRG